MNENVSGETIGKWAHPAVILVATDLSELDRIMPFAIDQAVWVKARIAVLHVIGTGEAMSADAVGMPYYNPEGAAEISSKLIAPWVELAGQRGVECEMILREGGAAEEILNVARQLHADRVVVGTTSHGKISKFLLGSTAERVLRHTHVPVVTIGPEAHWELREEERVLLHATQLLDDAAAHAELAEQVAQTLDAKLVLLHVVRPGTLTAHDAEDEAGQKLKTLADGITRAGVEIRVVHGDAPEEILAEARRLRPTLIVLGSTPRPPLEDVTRNRTVYRVLAHAQCPVMTLHAAR